MTGRLLSPTPLEVGHPAPGAPSDIPERRTHAVGSARIPGREPCRHGPRTSAHSRGPGRATPLRGRRARGFAARRPPSCRSSRWARRSRAGRRSSRPRRGEARRHAVAGRARLAAAPRRAHPADPRHLVDRPPRGEPRRRRAPARRRRGDVPGRQAGQRLLERAPRLVGRPCSPRPSCSRLKRRAPQGASAPLPYVGAGEVTKR